MTEYKVATLIGLGIIVGWGVGAFMGAYWMMGNCKVFYKWWEKK